MSGSNPSRTALAAVCCVIGALLLPVAASAKSTDRNQPMDVQSDRLEGSDVQGTDTVLTGNVLITQGTLRVSADRGIISRANDDISRVVLEGAPATLHQQLDDGATMDARAKRIDYDRARNVIVLTGAVVIEQPRGNMQGERVVYNLDTGTVDAGGAGGRVRLVIPPKAPAPATAVPAAAPTDIPPMSPAAADNADGSR